VPPEAIIRAARAFCSAASGTVIFVPGASKQRNDLISYFARRLAGMVNGKKFINFYGYGNTLGTNIILDRLAEGHVSYGELIEKIDQGKIKALFMLGDDMTANHPALAKKIGLAKLLIMTGYFKGDRPDESTATFPLASHMEASGSYVLADHRLEELEPIAPAVGGKTNANIISRWLNQPDNLAALRAEAKKIVVEGIKLKKVLLAEKAAEAQGLVAAEQAVMENVTHFGNNSLVKNFFWYRVNNRL
jgi:hypothetical protein